MNTTTALKEISSEIEFLFSLTKKPMTIAKKAGEVLMNEGETGNLMYVVKSGAIDIVYKGTRLERVTTGGIVGAMAIVDKAPRSATAVAHKDSVLILIDRARFMHLIRRNPEFALFVMSTLIRRIRQMNVRLEMTGKKRR